MIKAIIFLLLLFLFFSPPMHAQTYAAQYESCSKLFNVTNNTPDSLFGKLLDALDSCLVGTVAPNFKARDINGYDIELEKLKGQVIVLNFWAMGCGPCVEEMPELNKLIKLYAGKKVSFISLTSDSLVDVKIFFKKHPFTYATIEKSEDIRVDTFKLLDLFPYSIIIDREGKINKIWVGGFGDQKEVIPFYKHLIDKLL